MVKKLQTIQKVIDLYTVPNPEKINLIKLGKFHRYKSEYISLGHGQFLPPGSAYFHYKATGSPIGLPPLPKNSKEDTSIELRDNQIPVVEACKNIRCGLIEFKTGGGKAVILSALHEIWGSKSLVVVHSVDMVEQFKETFKKFLDIDSGVYYSGEKKIKDITITTFQSAVKNQSLFEEYGFDNLFIDEADEFFTPERRKFVCTFPCIRKFGFTGTIKTKYDEHLKYNKNISCLVRFYGKHIVGVSDNTKNPLVGIFYKKYEKVYTENVFGTDVIINPNDWIPFKKALAGDIDRKRAQIRYILDNYNSGDRVLVLLNSVDDIENYHRVISGLLLEDNVFKVYGSTKKKERDECKQKFKDEGGIMVANYRVAGRGWDVESCNKVFILFPIKGENAVRQMIGRIIRQMEGKKSFVYDWIDSSLLFQWKKRKKTYLEFFNLTPEKL